MGKREERGYLVRGTESAWYQGWDISDEKREVFRETSATSRKAKAAAMAGTGPCPVHEIYTPRLDPRQLMPRQAGNGLRSLSLFSGGGGLDLGFDLAGFEHVASFDVLEAGGQTIRRNRPNWDVRSGDAGDVTRMKWKKYRGLVDVIHGGPPCQPFSTAGRQMGVNDPRNMLPEFVRSVLEIKPAAFVMENVPAMFSPKFAEYLQAELYSKLKPHYHTKVCELRADDFGIPQIRRRGIVVGFRSQADASRFSPPSPTHHATHLRTSGRDRRLQEQPSLWEEPVVTTPCLGVRGALGLPDIGFDALAPTLRSALTGPRHTTSVLSSTAAARQWAQLQIWPNGVARDRASARAFVAKDGHFRLSVPDCALLQGFPEDWEFHGAVYLALGQIGNSVSPPMAYQLALAVAQATSCRS